MFRWLRGAGDGLAEVQQAFIDMLGEGRHVFDLAMTVRVGGADPYTVAHDLNKTEASTDETERRIRRLVLVHASVHGAADIPACLMYMSISKDAERISDLSKNIFGIGETVGPPPSGAILDDFIRLKDTVSPMIAEAARIFAADDAAAAEGFIERAREVQHHCTEQIDRVLREEAEVAQPAATVLTYRQIGRIVANLLNIVSAVVVPLDQLDYPTPDAGDDADEG